MLTHQRSFRAARLSELVRFGTERARVGAELLHDGLEHEVELTIANSSRRLELDTKAIRSASDWPRGMSVVLFTPDELRVPKGSPGERRRMLDRAIASAWPTYLELSRDYAKVVQTRNRLLRDERRATSGELVATYDEQLARFGAKVIATRTRYLRTIREPFVAAFARIFPDEPAARLDYSCTVDVADQTSDLDALYRALREELTAQRHRDIARGVTGSGPHADDLRFTIGERDARAFASQGQTRGLVLAFKIAQILSSYDAQRRYPPLLLDDVSSELDPGKNKYLFDFLSEISFQVIITTTRPELVALSDERLDYQLVRGAIRS